MPPVQISQNSLPMQHTCARPTLVSAVQAAHKIRRKRVSSSQSGRHWRGKPPRAKRTQVWEFGFGRKKITVRRRRGCKWDSKYIVILRVFFAYRFFSRKAIFALSALVFPHLGYHFWGPQKWPYIRERRYSM